MTKQPTMYQFPSDPPRWISPRSLAQPRAQAFRRPTADKRIPDLHSQLEALLDAVWEAEANWRFDDLLDQLPGS